MNYLTMISISLWAFSIGLYIGMYHHMKIMRNETKIEEKEEGKEVTDQELEVMKQLLNLLNYDGNPQKKEVEHGN